MSLKDKKQKAIELRHKGFSYAKILKELDLTSKGTLSKWLRDLTLTENTKKRLKSNAKLAIKRGLDKFNRKRSLDILEQNKKSIESGKQEVVVNNRKELLITGAALYWGEGTKYIGKHPALIFTNSDPDMIKIYMNFLRQGLVLDEQKIKAGIHIHPYVDENSARSFWAKISGLPENLFYIVKVIISASKGKRSTKKLPYGMVVIKVNNRHVFYRVKGMIEGLKIINTRSVI